MEDFEVVMQETRISSYLPGLVPVSKVMSAAAELQISILPENRMPRALQIFNTFCSEAIVKQQQN